MSDKEQVLQTLLDAANGEIVALTAECERLAEVRNAAVAVPQGWHMRKSADGEIVVQRTDVGGYVARHDADNIASTILYYLADDLLAAPASAPSVDRNAVLEEAARYLDDVHCISLGDEIRRLKSAAPAKPEPAAYPLDFSRPLETIHGKAVTHICSDVIEYECARVCVDQSTGIVYSSPYIGLKIRNAAAPVAQPLAPSGAVPDGFVIVPDYRGYANLGTGQYVLNHSDKESPAELIISLATEAEKAGRTVGDERENAPGTLLQPEAMAVRIRFSSLAGLNALENQLRKLRCEHFPSATQPLAGQDVRAVTETLKRCADVARCYDLGTPDGHAIAVCIEALAAPSPVNPKQEQK